MSALVSVHPRQFFRDEVVDALGLAVKSAAEILGVRRATLSSLLNWKAGLSQEMVLRFEKAFGISMDMVLRIQGLYDANTSRAQADGVSVARYVVADGTSR